MAKYIWIVLGCVVVLLVAYFFWPTPATIIKNYPSTDTDIIAFGDSLVSGEGATDGHSFVALLSAAIGRPIVNLGVPGETSAQGLARVGDIDHYNPKVVLLLLGGNDAIQKVPQKQTFDNLAKIIENIQKRGGIVLLLGIRGAALSDPYESQFEKLSKQYGTAYVSNVLQGLFGDSRYMSDSVHPNDQGYAMIAKRIEPVLKGLLY